MYAFGLSLPQVLPSVADQRISIQLFLSRLSTLLNATLSRRRQFLALRTTYSCEEFAALDLRVFNSESSDRAVVEWDLATVEGGDEQDSDNIARDRLVVVQLAFRDLATEALELLDDVLVRCVSRSPESGAFHALISSLNVSTLSQSAHLPRLQGRHPRRRR